MANKNSTYASRCYFFILYLVFPKHLTAIYISLAKIGLTPSSFKISKNILSAFFFQYSAHSPLNKDSHAQHLPHYVFHREEQ